MDRPVILALDLGAESGRAVLARIEGERIELEEVHRFPNEPVSIGGHLYWDALRLFAETRRGLGHGARRAGRRLGSVGLCTWGVDHALLDREGELLANPYCYRDPRTAPMMERVFARIPREELFQRTGIQSMQLNALYQLYATSVLKPSLVGAAGTFLMIADLFNYWLTGEKCSELTIASTSQFLEARETAWSREVFERLDLPLSILPPLVLPGTRLGPLLPTGTEEPALSGVPVIAVASHDTASAVAAVPSRGPECFYLSSGTWSALGAEVGAPLITPRTLQGNFTNERGAAGTYLLRKNIMGLWLLQESRRTWALSGQELDYPALVELAARSRPFGPMVEVDHESFLAPGDMPSRIADFCRKTDQEPPAGVGEVARCVLESLALKYRWVLEQLEEAMGRKAEMLHVVGGGSRNALLCQLTANAVGRPVLAGPREATTMGNVIVQGMACGWLASLAEGRELIRRSVDLASYEPRDRAGWDGYYQRFLQLKRRSTTML